ncbi:hypothetical protein [Aromatoleum evansii]|uniref:hypothetical protein n=1 Tax=Aromatoleum evansii TaxID=59406 RepID=UPI00145F15B6|nr:hypothetical protein [Aromatoleum evansii]NMG29444.1 hypothetical protein [Aromatoleum evansii]
MLLRDNKYISQAIYAVRFRERDDGVRLKQAEAEKAFSSFMGGQSNQTNVPDNFDPNAPRIVFQGNHKGLLISQLSCQFDQNFEPKALPLDRQVETIEKNVRAFHARLLAFKEERTLSESALILSVNIPSDIGLQKLHTHLADRFLKSTPLGELASVSFKVGYKTDDNLFLNLEANVYELRRAELDQSARVNAAVIDIASIPVVEEGFGIKIDINDRPKKMADLNYVVEGPDRLLATAFGFVKDKLDEVMGLSAN